MPCRSKPSSGLPLSFALIFLVAIPVTAGAIRVGGLAAGAEITPDNARFFAAPWAVASHIVASTLFCVVGAFQFAAGLRRRYPRWHRFAGRILAPAGLIAGLSGMWMTVSFPPVDGDGPLLFALRLFFGAAMILCLGRGLLALRERNFVRHGAWMTRGYAIGVGAGTQAIVHLPFLVVGMPGELGRALLLGAGWVINLAVAQWCIHRAARSYTADGLVPN